MLNMVLLVNLEKIIVTMYENNYRKYVTYNFQVKIIPNVAVTKELYVPLMSSLLLY